jgi:hypothetical protein
LQALFLNTKNNTNMTNDLDDFSDVVIYDVTRKDLGWSYLKDAGGSPLKDTEG